MGTRGLGIRRDHRTVVRRHLPVPTANKIGLLPVVLTEDEVNALADIAERDPAATVAVDLAEQTVTADGLTARFDIDPFVKHSLLNGLDEIALTLAHDDAIAEFEASRHTFRPTVIG